MKLIAAWMAFTSGILFTSFHAETLIVRTASFANPEWDQNEVPTARVVVLVEIPDGIAPGTLRIRDGRIVGAGPHDDRPAGVEVLDAGELVVLPGLVDTHVHINDPGRSHWEGFETATRAAAPS